MSLALTQKEGGWSIDNHMAQVAVMKPQRVVADAKHSSPQVHAGLTISLETPILNSPRKRRGGGQRGVVVREVKNPFHMDMVLAISAIDA